MNTPAMEVRELTPADRDADRRFERIAQSGEHPDVDPATLTARAQKHAEDLVDLLEDLPKD